MWSKQFLAMSAKKNYKNVLIEKTTIPAASDVIDTSNNAEKAKLKAREDNNNAYHNLILSNTNKVASNIMDKVITTDLPDGDAFLAWKILSSNCNSKSSTVVVGLSNEFNKAKLTNLSIDPEDWIVELEILQSRLGDMNYPITEKHLMVHIMYNLPKEHNIVIEADKKIINDVTNPLDIETLKDHLHTKLEKIVWRKKISVDGDKNKTVGEALIVGSQFKGHCTFCDKK